MRLPFPERISYPVAILFATVLLGMQQLQRTSLAFSLYCFLFIVIATMAFNAAGGFTRPSGSYVFFYAILGFIVGVCYKVVLGEPGDSNLLAPTLTAQVFAGGIAAMLVAVVISRKISRKSALLKNVVKDKDLRNATIGCICFGAALSLIGAVFPHQNGSVISALIQVNRFLPLGIILGTTHAIKKSNGAHTFSPVVLFAFVLTFALGLLSFSKEGIFEPFLCWLVTAASLRVKFKPFEILTGLCIGAFLFVFLVPYSQVGRNYRQPEASFFENASISFNLLMHLGDVRAEYERDRTVMFDVSERGYYDSPQGFFDRLTMISFDDSLINVTAEGSVYGLSGIPLDFANWIPHFLWPSKPTKGAGNYFAHEIGGIVGDEDTTTGISFSPTGEAFHLAKWTGVFLVAPLVWILLFTVFDSICGDVRQSPWGLLVIAIFAHLAPEGMLDGAIYTVWYGSIAIVFAAVTSARLLPIVGTLLAGPERAAIMMEKRASSIPRRAHRPLPRAPGV